ncbi:MerR family transcriptional regulator [Nocardia halotolerans]|uniref:MerR family transcriptional regulator n=1 Tax=Nocardia halotolerans TaxID=1755878 RepID=A0ABV8VEJ6_9NOCA
MCCSVIANSPSWGRRYRRSSTRVEVQAEVARNAYLTIGELADHTGVAVRTIRFYCDEGLLVARRTSGGHRVFEPAEVERLNSLRRLRALGIGLAAIGDVFAGARTVSEVLAAERDTVAAELAALRHRSALLTAAESVSHSRVDAVDLLAGVADPCAAHDALIGFWRRQLGPLRGAVVHDFIDMNVPGPPVGIEPDQLIVYAELVAAVGDPALDAAMLDAVRHRGTAGVRDEEYLLRAVADACLAAAPLVAAGAPPGPGMELDQYVDAHATARAERDTADFRRRLLRDSAGGDRRVRRYWELTAVLTGVPVSSGAVQLWLFDALAASVS